MSRICPTECYLERACKCGERLCAMGWMRLHRNGEKTIHCTLNKKYGGFNETGDLCQKCAEITRSRMLERDREITLSQIEEDEDDYEKEDWTGGQIH